MNGLEIVEYKFAEIEYYKKLVDYITKKLKKLGNLLNGYEEENGERFSLDNKGFFEFHHERSGLDIVLRFFSADERDQPIQAEFLHGTQQFFVSVGGGLVTKYDSVKELVSLDGDKIQVNLGILSSINRALDEFLPYLAKKKNEFNNWTKVMDNKWERDWSGVKI